MFGTLPQNMSRPTKGSCETTGNDPYMTQASAENGHKQGWTAKFNSMGSNSTASATEVSSGVGNPTSSMSICLECKDVVDNIGRKNMTDYCNQLEVTQLEQHHRMDMRTPKSSVAPLGRELRNLRTQSMIFE